KRVLDYAAGILIMLNSVVMLLELQLGGLQLGSKVGYATQSHDGALRVCTIINDGFSIVFFLELVLRVAVERRTFLLDAANWLDAALAIGGLVDFFITISMEETSASQSIILLRLVRVMKSLRAIRMVRSFKIFRGLRVLVKACGCFLPSLCWAMVLLGVLMSMGSLLIGNLLQDFIADETLEYAHRLWLWEHYGTAWRATYTLFEVTMAGNWPVNAEPVLELNQAFSLFFIFYVTIVVFAVIRVITAVFLKDTLEAAQNDAEQLVADKIAIRNKLIARLEGIFNVMDREESGMITEERLSKVLANPKAAAYFQTLDLDVHEGRALFNLLDNGDGEVTQEEFISGILRCKGQARAIEQVAMHSE
ncbi:Voltage-dependent T-type calcium channel subunit alpha-1I (CaVT.3) (Voltage-gated calcium channel subunit alpha Cav3.3), partial [Durusdinium trenchii]